MSCTEVKAFMKPLSLRRKREKVKIHRGELPISSRRELRDRRTRVTHRNSTGHRSPVP